MKRFRDLNSQEKLLVGALVILLALIAFNWNSFAGRVKRSLSVYTEQPSTKNKHLAEELECELIPLCKTLPVDCHGHRQRPKTVANRIF